MTDRLDLRTLSGSAHFVGVGGAGMCALAELFLRHGLTVTGCDAKDSEALRNVEALGGVVFVGHDPEHVVGAEVVIVTAALPDRHPEIVAANERGIPVLKRAEALGRWVNDGRVVAIAGTHGKTTTTAMTTQILAAADLDPTGIVGGRVRGWGGNLRYGEADLFVVEADEYDKSFHTLTPDVAVITNLEADHLEIYGDLEGVKRGFMDFVAGVRNGGRVIVCADDHGASSLLPSVGPSGYTYGTNAGSMLRAVDVHVTAGSTRCVIVEDGETIGALSMSFGGRHNLLNALAAAAAARALGVDWSSIRRALESFDGVGRRFDHVGDAAGVTVIDDYAHHPTEVSAALRALRAMHPTARLVAAFQPHLYSRTRDFATEFGQALSLADVVFVTDVFPAREKPLAGVTGELVVNAAREVGTADVRYVEQLDDLPGALVDELTEGDVAVTLGAGSIERVGAEVVAALREVVHA